MVAPVALDDVEPLEDGTHLLHVGPQKTGSTALQFALLRQRETLREHGVVYPGPGSRARYALGAGLGYATPRGARDRPQAAWNYLLKQVNDPSARVVCVSHEAFARGRRPRIARTVEALGGPKPHVLAVARRYDAVLPSQWQQRVKARLTLSYDEWLRIVLGPKARHNPVWNVVWMAHDTVSMARRWVEVVGADNVTVLVADDADRSRLPTVVERLLGVPAGLLAPADAIANRSLTYAEVELLRAMNRHFEERGYSGLRYHRLVSHGMIPALVGSERHPHDPSIPPLPAWAWEPLVERSARRVEGLDELGVRIVGDPSTLLLPDQPPHRTATAAEPGALRVPVDVAARALLGLVDAAARDRALTLERLGVAEPDEDEVENENENENENDEE